MEVEKRSRGAYAPGMATRDSIVISAMQLVAEKGLQGFSLRDLAKVVGISHPAVIYHFPSKNALMTAAVKRFEDEMGIFKVHIDEQTGELVDDGMLVDSIEGFVHKVMLMSVSDDAALLWGFETSMTIEAPQENHPAHAHAIYRTFATLTLLEKEIERLTDKYNLSLPLKPSAMAMVLLREWNGMGIQARYRKELSTHVDVAEEFIASVTCILQLPIDFILGIGDDIPGECEEVFARVIRRIRQISAS